MRTLQLYATGSASTTTTPAAQVTIPTKSRIKGIQFCLLIDSVTDNADVTISLSKTVTNQNVTNNALDPFVVVGSAGNFATSGLAQFSVVQFLPVDVECRQGEIISAHVTVTGTITYKVTAIIHYS